MNIVGSFDREVGILYSVNKSAIQGKDIWFTNEEFNYFIGPIVDNKYVTIPKAFLTDGASVPRLFWSIFPPWGVYGQAAIVHDFLCDNKMLTMNGDVPRCELTYQQIDSIFYDAMKVAGTPVWKRALIYAAVRVFHNLGI